MRARTAVLFTLGALGLIGTGVGIGIKLSHMNSATQNFSAEQIRRFSPNDWMTRRSIVQKQYCSAGNTPEGARLQKLLWLFDSVKREMETPIKGSIYSHPREHGWNLYKPE